SRIDAKTLGLSGRGRHIHSTRPLGATRQFASQSDRNAYSAMGGNELAILIGAGTAPTCGAACPSPSVSGLMACPRSFSSALRAHALPPRGQSIGGGTSGVSPRARVPALARTGAPNDVRVPALELGIIRAALSNAGAATTCAPPRRGAAS